MSAKHYIPVFTPFFKDAAAQKELEEKGYVVVKNFINKNEISALLNSFNEHANFNISNFHVSNYSKDFSKNVLIDKEVKAILLPHIEKTLTNYRPITGLFYIKPANKKSNFHIHKDWSLIDERHFSSLHIWTALCDITNVNGNLFVYEGSHRSHANVRGCPNFEYPKESILNRIKSPYKKVNIYLNEGDALVFDHRIKHGSLNNNSAKVRVTAGISVIPKNASLVHYHKNSSGTIEMYEVPDDFYLKFNLTELPDNIKSAAIVDHNFFKK